MPSGEHQAWGQGRLSQLPVIVAKFLIPVTHLRYRPLMSKWVGHAKRCILPIPGHRGLWDSAPVSNVCGGSHPTPEYLLSSCCLYTFGNTT